MKKRLLTLFAIVFTLSLFAQQGDVVLCEGFSALGLRRAGM